MKLSDSFAELRALIRSHDIEPNAFDTLFIPEPYEPVDDELPSNGLKIKLSEVASRGGLFAHNNRQVLLYMQKHTRTGRFESAIKGVVEEQNKYHLCKCKHIKKEESENREGNYVITEDLSGTFFICGGKDAKTGVIPEGYAKLNVCKMCLEALNYKGYRDYALRKEIFKEFNLADFFCDYGALFNRITSRVAGNKYEEDYSKDWKKISLELRDRSKWECSECSVNFGKRSELLHVHHVNGVRRDNKGTNLRVLCVDCHKKQPNHAHLHLKHYDAKRINLLRRHQGLLDDVSWDNVKKYADTCVYGFLDLCKEMDLPAPQVAIVVDNVYFDLAWPDKSLGLVIDTEQGGLNGLRERSGWYATGLDKEFLALESFVKRLAGFLNLEGRGFEL